MKPVGLRDPRTGESFYAVVQLRQEDMRADSYNLVGFQNHLKYGEQKRILRLIPGLERAEFLRYGQIHRNTYINAPALLTGSLHLRSHPNLFFAGQLSGVEGLRGIHRDRTDGGPQRLALGRRSGPTDLAASHGPTARWPPISRAQTRTTISRPTLPSIFCRRFRPKRQAAIDSTRRRGGGDSVNADSKSFPVSWRPMLPSPHRPPTLAEQIGRFLDSLRRANLSQHTIENYGADLEQFRSYLSPAGTEPPTASEVDPLLLREFMAHCFDRGNANRSVSRKLSSLRAFFKFLHQQGEIPSNPAKLVSMPKTPQKLPAVMTAEQAQRARGLDSHESLG